MVPPKKETPGEAGLEDAESSVGHPAAGCQEAAQRWVWSLKENLGLETKI